MVPEVQQIVGMAGRHVGKAGVVAFAVAVVALFDAGVHDEVAAGRVSVINTLWWWS